MANEYYSKDAVELLILKSGQSNKTNILGEIEKIYIKKADFNKFFNELLDGNPYFKAVKWFIAAILMTFSSTIIAAGFFLYNFFNG